MTRLQDPWAALGLSRDPWAALMPQPVQPSFRPAERRITPEEEVSLLRQMAGGAANIGLSGLAMAGNLLDVPFSMTRDVAATALTGKLHNPLDQLLTPLSHENRVPGRDLLTMANLAAPNKETGISGWLEDPKEAVRDIAGLGVELMLGPPAGAFAGAARLLAPQARALGRAGAAAAPARLQAAGRATRDLGQGLGREGRLFWNQLFDAGVMGKRHPVIQSAARGLSRKKLEATQQTLGDVLPLAKQLPEAQLTDEVVAKVQDVISLTSDPRADLAKQTRMAVEGLAPQTAPVRAIKELQEAERIKRSQDGLPSGALRDPSGIEYSHRRMGEDVRQLFDRPKGAQRTRGPLSAADPMLVGRQEVWKGFARGTSHVDELLMDPAWDRVIESAIENKPTRKAAISSLRDAIQKKYGNEVLPSYQRRTTSGKLVFKSTDGRKVLLTDEQIAANGRQLPDGSIVYTKTVRGKPAETQILNPVTQDRYRELARIIFDNPELQVKGIFTNHAFVDAHAALEASRHDRATLDTIIEVISQPEVQLGTKSLRRGAGTRETTIGDILNRSRVNKDIGARRVAEAMGLDIPDDVTEQAKLLQRVRQTVIKPSVSDELLSLWPQWKSPDEVGTLGKIWDSATSIWKAGVLTAPARYVRDITSGMVRNFERGWFDHKTGYDAHRILQGKTVSGYTDIPAVKQWLKRTGGYGDQDATRALAEMFASYKATPAYAHTDVPGGLAAPGRLEDLLGQVPGTRPALDPRQILRTALGREPGTSLGRFWEVRGFHKEGRPLTESVFGLARTGDIFGQYTDNMVRLQPWLNQLRKGVDPAEAMRKVMEAQVDYAPRAFTEVEKKLKRLLPFYAFSSRQISYLRRELVQNPQGRLSKIIRAQAVGGRTDVPLPEYISQTGAIPLGENEQGDKAFLTSLGLMHEDPLSFLGGGLEGLGAETLSRTNPMIKAPIEAVFGQSAFQRGPMGGRSLADMDPPLGRLFSNLGLRDLGPDERARPVISRGFEHLMSNMPTSRLVTTARTLSDPRKAHEGTRIPGGAALLNALTGMRISHLSPAAQDRAIREQIDATLTDDLGGQMFQRSYVPQPVLEQTRARDPDLFGRMEAGRKLQNLINRRNRERRMMRQLEQQRANWTATP